MGIAKLRAFGRYENSGLFSAFSVISSERSKIILTLTGDHNGDIPMLAACAILPFLPLIVDAHIRQLGDDDFAKREASTRFLKKLLQETDGIRNYEEVLVMVKKTQEDKNPEIRLRARQLYQKHKANFFLEYPYICITIKVDNVRKDDSWRESIRKLRPIVAEVDSGFVINNSWSERGNVYHVICHTKGLDSAKLKRIQARKEFVKFSPLNDKYGVSSYLKWRGRPDLTPLPPKRS
jgi:hypothetical protein